MAESQLQTKTSKQKWFPLESNPNLLNKYILKLGFDTSFFKFYDVYSTEDWALEMIPQPVIAVVMLYPLTKVQEEYRVKENSSLEKQNEKYASGVWHVKQRIGNACGTIGVLHALANIPDSTKVAAITSGSWLDQYYSTCPAALPSVTKAEVLENDEDISKMHEAATSDEANQTSRGSLKDEIDTHFVSIVNVNGGIYELDGRKEGPISHGDVTSETTFLKEACDVVKKFMQRDPEESRFTILALAAATNAEE